MRILHVDDDADDRELFSAAIKRVDPNIIHLEASGGEEAYKMLSDDHMEHIDCIFLDINMPSLDGISLLTMLKEHPVLKSIPVVIHSTTSDVNEINCVERLGAYFFPKCIDFQVYVTSLREILQPWMSETINSPETYTRYYDSRIPFAGNAARKIGQDNTLHSIPKKGD
jgi:CheY-like chemotaxis protein